MSMTKNVFRLALAASGTYLAMSTSAFGETKLKDAGDAVRTAIYDITDKGSAELRFAKGSDSLTDAQKSELKSMITAFTSDGKTENVVVVAYADKNYPRGSKNDLAKEDRDLATRRGETVKKHLDSVGAKDVTVYNMAEKANWFEKTFVTKDAQVKREAKEDVGDTSDNDAFYEALGRHLGKTGGPGKVVVVMRHKNSGHSH